MIRKAYFSFLLIFVTLTVFSQEKQIKNIILMIPDGCSLATISSARWYQWYNNPDKPSLNIDPYICGTVLTFCSNAPIGDSAPTTSCYMTGVPSLTGYVSTYPVADKKNDIYPLDSTKAYQPLMTLMEAARIIKNMATGLVFTCEFPHATPADCYSHSYNRSKYEWIAPQMVHNKIDVVIGGGVSILNQEMKDYLTNEGYGVFTDNIQQFRNYSGKKMWSLFAPNDMSYDLDRDKSQQPSLAEMTLKAIEKLSSIENGFFLMVEGSKIDWGAHANDPIAMITETLAFDEACGKAIDFAKKNGETLVIIVSDHGNSGISIGVDRCKNYSKLTKDQLFKNVSQYKVTAPGLIDILHKTDATEVKSVFKKYVNIDLSEENLTSILQCEDYAKSSLSDEERMKGSNLNKIVSKILNENTCFGFTTGGHTGEEVLLAAYHPGNKGPKGFIRNFELNHYMAATIGLDGKLEKLTDEFFAKHSDVFKGYKYSIIKSQDNQNPVLTVKNKKKTLTITPFTDIVILNNKPVQLSSVIVYVDKNDTFYLPENLRKMLE